MSKIAKSANKIMSCYEHFELCIIIIIFFSSQIFHEAYIVHLYKAWLCGKHTKYTEVCGVLLIQRMRHILTWTITYCTCVRYWEIAWSLETHASWEAFQRKFKILYYWEL